MKNPVISLTLLAGLLFITACTKKRTGNDLPLLKVSENSRYLADEHGNPFFWLGDTGWLLFSKLTREEAERYLSDRAAKGFNVIQVMVLQSLNTVNAYGDSALAGNNVSAPIVTPGSSFKDSIQYDYWDHVDYIIDMAARKGLYMGLVPVWGTNVRNGQVGSADAGKYAAWLAQRYKDRPNIIWLNGGDVKGSDSTATWNIIGSTLDSIDKNHLITFHPFGRTCSSTWFHNEEWLDFNMFQSGHRRYDQDDTEWAFGEDNWRYVNHDYTMLPVKPTLDGEPSYEGIPQGLHDPSQPYWNDNDVRRYAYWSVFAGGFGFTYGHNAIMQFYKSTDQRPAYGARVYWDEAISAPGSGQLQHLRNLMLSRPFFDRVPDQSMIAGENGSKYDYVAATRGKNYAFIYTYNGKAFTLNMGKISGKKVKVTLFRPADGTYSPAGEFENSGLRAVKLPCEPKDGNDWVLILDSIQ